MAEEVKNERRFEPEALEAAKNFSYGDFSCEDGCSIKYRWFAPDGRDGDKLPLFIFLHGGGERGSDNELQVCANRGAYTYALPESQLLHPCRILAPQCPEDSMFTFPEFERTFMALLRSFVSRFPTDMNRIYISGLSMGGIGTWYYISKYPELFAAGVPICGAGNPYTVSCAKNVPVWAFHAADDPVVPIDDVISGSHELPEMVGTRRMVEALRAAGGNVRFTEYPSGYIASTFGIPSEYAGHFAWEPAYRSVELREWLFAQDRSQQDSFELVRPGVWFFSDCMGDSYYLIEGRDRSLLIDTGMGSASIMPLLRKISDKPIDLAVTHAHGDHMLHADEFDRVYIPAGEREILPQFMSSMMPGLKLREGAVQYINDGDIIDIGGVYIEAIALSGHTPGSTLYADYRHKCLFTGDATGSGIFVLMSIPGSLSLGEYRRSLLAFLDRAERFDDFIWLGGHRRQERGTAFADPFSTLDEHPMAFNPLHRKVVDDMAELCRALISGEITGTEVAPFGNIPAAEPTLMASLGSASMMYFKSQLK